MGTEFAYEGYIYPSSLLIFEYAQNQVTQTQHLFTLNHHVVQGSYTGPEKPGKSWNFL